MMIKMNLKFTPLTICKNLKSTLLKHAKILKSLFLKHANNITPPFNLVLLKSRKETIMVRHVFRKIKSNHGFVEERKY